MRVFISWSGNNSQSIANYLHDWIPCIIQEADVWVSAQDIQKGQKWLSSVSQNLSDTNFGIVIVTPENKLAPWLMFEAGALSKSLESRVIALLCELEHNDVAGTPLFQFQNATISKKEVLSAMISLNSFANRPLPKERLTSIFEKFWPEFDSFYDGVRENLKVKTDGQVDQTAKMTAMMEEVARSLQRLQRTDPIPRQVMADTLRGWQSASAAGRDPHDYRSRIEVRKKPFVLSDIGAIGTALSGTIKEKFTMEDSGGTLKIVFNDAVGKETIDKAIEFLQGFDWFLGSQVRLFE